MSVIKEPKPVHREFEMERLILFSDAVFAIAITLLIIEIKLPHIPDKLPAGGYIELMKPLYFEFFAFAVSFGFIGNMWIRHLHLYRFIQNYNEGLIHRNLFFLFFVVTFPFSTSAMLHLTPHFMLPLFIYMCNMTGCLAALFWVSYYVFQRNPHLAITGFPTDKELLYQRYKYNFFTMATGFTCITMAYFIFPENAMMQRISYLLLPVLALINYFRIRIKKRNTLRLVHIAGQE
ncbi:MAG TPA: TMEM175 family protein [Chitinophaga sp.]|uniref:TMEM175 family protein n=1 Tax=Chitinophaga sp. TaxID=1869181 RepID=UPI002BC9B6FD|nr:TMEM175 family protein [Chitinophaga sp.]HVI48434.1 TMEM175 family protein [Chitinophaga sp.]